MNIHEYQGKKLLSSVQIPVPVSILATNPLDCVKAFDLYGPIVIKAQVHSGGRGKAGGVMLVKSAEEAFRVGSSLLGSTLVTNQTGGRGLKVTKLLCEPIAQIKQEMYLS
ncbi:MAG: succinate--CoA ligase subunit beta, partial [Deltaproteobacteria bacterium]|nr:succinate--CoA ligase subunit beta [Deltaproteobacteria bacterium]